jgi:hypothetical protein
MNKKDVDTILTRVGTYDRFEAFLHIACALEGKLYWYALRNAYDMSDDLFHYKERVLCAFSSSKPNREKLMSKSEQVMLASLPSTVRIWRGMTLEEKTLKIYGVSWTLDKAVAEYFANVYPRNHSTGKSKKIVVSLEVPRESIIAIFDEREEKEVIYLPLEYKSINLSKMSLTPLHSNDPYREDVGDPLKQQIIEEIAAVIATGKSLEADRRLRQINQSPDNYLRSAISSWRIHT